MCYNCGCGDPDDAMGKPVVHGASLTDESIKEMSKDWEMTEEETLKNIQAVINLKLGKQK